MAKSLSPSIRVKLWKLALGDVDLYREYLLDLLLMYFDIDEDRPNERVLEDVFDEDSLFEETPDNVSKLVIQLQELFVTAPRGNRGVRGKIKDRLLWYLRETGETQDRIIKATQLYIDECIQTDTFALSPQNFVHKAERFGERRLEDSILHEYVQRLDEDNTPLLYNMYDS